MIRRVQWQPSLRQILLIWALLTAWHVFALTSFEAVYSSATLTLSWQVPLSVGAGCLVGLVPFIALNRHGTIVRVICSWGLLWLLSATAFHLVSNAQLSDALMWGRFVRLSLFGFILAATLTVLAGAPEQIRAAQRQIIHFGQAQVETIAHVNERARQEVSVLRRQVSGPLRTLMMQLRASLSVARMSVLAEEFRAVGAGIRQLSHVLHVEPVSRPLTPARTFPAAARNDFSVRAFALLYAFLVALVPYAWEERMGVVAALINIIVATGCMWVANRFWVLTTQRRVVIAAAVAVWCGGIAGQLTLWDAPWLSIRLVLSLSALGVGALFGAAFFTTSRLWRTLARTQSEAEFWRSQAQNAEANALGHVAAQRRALAHTLHSAVQGKLAAAAAACEQAVLGQRSEDDAHAIAELAIRGILEHDLPAIESDLSRQDELLHNPWNELQERWSPFVRLVLPADIDEPWRHDVLVVEAVSEAIANAIRHGSAHTVTVSLCPEADGTTLEIRNDGRPPSRVSRGFGSRHFGAVARADWTLSADESGTLLRIPLRSPSAPARLGH